MADPHSCVEDAVESQEQDGVDEEEDFHSVDGEAEEGGSKNDKNEAPAAEANDGAKQASPGSPSVQKKKKRDTPKKKSPVFPSSGYASGQAALQPYFPAVTRYPPMMMRTLSGYGTVPQQLMPFYSPRNPNAAAGNAATLDYALTGQKPLAPYGYTDASVINDPSPDTRRNRGGVTEPFPEKLHKMLEATEKEGLTDVVGWFPHGRAFTISKPRRFVEAVMPRFFRQSRLTSFQRQLNLYGFRRISSGPDNGGYYHELFLRGRPGLCVNMKRTKVKGTVKTKTSPGYDPNFYSYPPIKTTNPIVPGKSMGLAATQASPQLQNKIGSPPTSPGTPLQAFPSPYFPFPQIQPMALAGPYTAAQQQPALGYQPQHGVYGLPYTPEGKGSPAKKKSPKRKASESPKKK